MKNYIWDSLKNQIFFGGQHGKPIQRGDYLKYGAWAVCRFKSGLGKKEGMVFLKGG